MTLARAELDQIHTLIRDTHQALGAARPALTPNDIPEAVVILGSPRSGSSWLFHVLAQSGAFWAPQGEETPFYRLGGLGFIDSRSDSDRLRPHIDEAVRARVFDHLMFDVGRTGLPLSGTEWTQYLAQCATRLIVQWPRRNWTPSLLAEALLTSVHPEHAPELNWSNLLAHLHIDPGWYDQLGRHSPNLQLELNDTVAEEPPFILQRPRARPAAHAKLSAPLLLKTSTNVYRRGWLQTLLPRTRLRFVILARNPAASINGLIDGWRSHAFHSHYLHGVTPLNIRGYTERVPHGDRWWKFDAPPGWADYAEATLPEVCAFQWRSAYEQLNTLFDQDHLLVRFEDLQAPARVDGEFERLFAFTAAKPLVPVAALANTPVMSSQPPRAGRWRARREEIEPVLHEARMRAQTERLGYDFDQQEAWP